jgi:ribosomal protein S18 acetylase RimI-like enzyme
MSKLSEASRQKLGKPVFQVRPLTREDCDWVSVLLVEHWGSARIVTRGKICHADELSGFVAVQGDKRIGFVTCRIDGADCEVVSMNSLVMNVGIGSALLHAVKALATAAKCKRPWLITTNDNTPALRFYQKRGFVPVAVYRNAVERSRKLKPEIPRMGADGIPIRDEIELEMLL